MIYSKCWVSLPNFTKFCPTCDHNNTSSGTMEAEVKKCPRCGAINKPTAGFCLKDGSPQEEEVFSKTPGDEDLTINKNVIICHFCGAPDAPPVKPCKKDGMHLEPAKDRTEDIPIIKKHI